MEYGAGALSILTIVCIIISMVISIGVPIGILVYFLKEKHGKITPVWIGVATFVLFSMVLEHLCHMVFLRLDWPVSRFLLSNGYAYATYGAFAAGIFEECGRLCAFTIVLKKYREKTTPFMYGIGHGGIEAIYIGGFTMISNLVLAIMLYSQGLDQSLSVYGSSADKLRPTFLQFYTTSSATFLVTGFERVLAIILQIALSILVYKAVVDCKKRYMFMIAILIHAIVDFPAALYQFGIIKNVMFVEAWCLIWVVITCWIAWYQYRENFNNVDEETKSF